MAEGIIFHYQYRGTLLHRLDPRTKMAAIFILSYTIFTCPSAGLSVLLLLFLALSISTAFSFGSYVRELTLFFFLGAAVFLGRWLSGGQIIAALTASARFFLAVWGGLLFMDSTSPEQSAQAIYALLKPVRNQKRGKTAAQILLSISFIPLIFDSAGEIREARRSRGEHPMKHPFRYTASFTVQLFDMLLLKAEEYSLALMSRGFDGTMHPEPLSFGRRDAAAAAVFLLIVMLAWAADIILHAAAHYAALFT
jgi:energy-coupling factor transport system permease protein